MRAVIFFLVALSGGFAQTSAQKGKQILDEAVAALGGEKFLRVRDRVETGRAYSFYRAELSGLSVATIWTRYLPQPDPLEPGKLLVAERESFGKEERSGAVLFFDGKGYEITWRGARPLPQETIDRYRDSTLHNVFYILRQRLGEPGLIVEWQRSDFVDNRPVEIVNITDADNRVVTVFFDRMTKLPVRQLYYRRNPVTRERDEEVTIYSKYRDVGGGVQWPFDIQRLRNGDQIFQIYSESVSINQGLADSLFQLPAGMKILPAARD
jgi:hypothetical protein